MIILRGSPALSSFRVQKLLSDFGQDSLPVKGIYAEFVHVVDLESDLTSEKKTTLEKLLTYGPSLEAKEPEGRVRLAHGAPRQRISLTFADFRKSSALNARLPTMWTLTVASRKKLPKRSRQKSMTA